MKSTKQKNRRESKRVPVKLLVNCEGWNMWTKDVAIDGVRLSWAENNTMEGFLTQNSEPFSFEPGQKVQVHGLIYTDQGSKPMTGSIRWVRTGKTKNSIGLGIEITTPRHREDLRVLEGAK